MNFFSSKAEIPAEIFFVRENFSCLLCFGKKEVHTEAIKCRHKRKTWERERFWFSKKIPFCMKMLTLRKSTNSVCCFPSILLFLPFNVNTVVKRIHFFCVEYSKQIFGLLSLEKNFLQAFTRVSYSDITLRMLYLESHIDLSLKSKKDFVPFHSICSQQ